MFVNPGEFISRVHALVNHESKPLLGVVETANNAEHLIRYGFKVSAVVKITRIYAVIQGKLGPFTILTIVAGFMLYILYRFPPETN